MAHPHWLQDHKHELDKNLVLSIKKFLLATSVHTFRMNCTTVLPEMWLSMDSIVDEWEDGIVLFEGLCPQIQVLALDSISFLLSLFLSVMNRLQLG